MTRRTLTPRPALSARELDRVQKELESMLAMLNCHKRDSWEACNVLHRRLTRVLGMLARSERR